MRVWSSDEFLGAVSTGEGIMFGFEEKAAAASRRRGYGTSTKREN
jgi:hypothetical protein